MVTKRKLPLKVFMMSIVCASVTPSHPHSPTTEYVAKKVIPLIAFMGSTFASLYTVIVFARSPVLPPAARLLLTPIGAGAAFGAAFVPYLLCEKLTSYLLKDATTEPNKDMQAGYFKNDCVDAGKVITRTTMYSLATIGALGAGICIAALCGNQQANSLIEWANSVQISINIA